MAEFPTHKAVQRSGFGIFAKEVAPGLPDRTVDYAHRDDYYVFGLVTGGTCRVRIDFGERELSAGDVVCIRPGQVHRVVAPGDARAFLLFLDGAFLDAPTKRTIAEYALSPQPFAADDVRYAELSRLFPMILRRAVDGAGSKTVLRHLSCAVAGIVTDAVREFVGRRCANRRHVEIVLALRELLADETQAERTVARCAEHLHLSPVYLNEAVRSVTGMSAGRYIRNEFLSRAKRMLLYTSLTVREIAFRLGVDDAAYFTRLFTKAVGTAPTAYRRKYLE